MYEKMFIEKKNTHFINDFSSRRGKYIKIYIFIAHIAASTSKPFIYPSFHIRKNMFSTVNSSRKFVKIAISPVSL